MRDRGKSEPPPFSGNNPEWESMPIQEMKHKTRFKINIGHRGITEDEVGFSVKFKESGKKKKFILALGQNGVRLLERESEEEVGRWNYKDIKNFTYNTSFNYFQFTTTNNNINVDSYTFHTKQCAEMFEQVKLLLAQNLKNNNVKDPDSLLQKATHQLDTDSPKKIGRKQEVREDEDNDDSVKRLSQLVKEQEDVQNNEIVIQVNSENTDTDELEGKVQRRKGRNRSHSTSDPPSDITALPSLKEQDELLPVKKRAKSTANGSKTKKNK